MVGPSGRDGQGVSEPPARSDWLAVVGAQLGQVMTSIGPLFGIQSIDTMTLPIF